MNEILTLKETADFLGINYFQATKLATAKKIPAFKVGRLWRVYFDDLMTYIRNQYTEQAPHPINIDIGDNSTWHYAKEEISGGLDYDSKVDKYKELLGL